MTTHASFYANNQYQPSDVMQRDADWISPGVLTSADLQVTAQSPAAMAVNVSGSAANTSGGNAWLPQGYRLNNDALLALAIAAADPTNPRIDIVVAAINTTTSPYTPVVAVVMGTAAASPVAPSMPAGYVGIVLAQIAVAAGATTLTQVNITDLRTIAGIQADSINLTSQTAPLKLPNLASFPAVGPSGSMIIVMSMPYVSDGTAWVDPMVDLMQLSTAHGGMADFYGPTTFHGGVGLTINALAVPAGLTATNASSGSVGAYILANTAYAYELTAVSYSGTETNAGTVANVTTGATAYPINLAWTAANADTQYINVYKGGLFLVQLAGTAVSYQDAGNVATTAQVPPSTNQTGNAKLSTAQIGIDVTLQRDSAGNFGVAAPSGAFYAGGKNGPIVAGNAYWNGTQWVQIDSSKPSVGITASVSGGSGAVFTAPASSSPWTSWPIQSTIMQAISGGYKKQDAQTSITVNTAGTFVTQSVTFPTAFSSAPRVFPILLTVGSSDATYVTLQAQSVTASGFTLQANSGVAQTLIVGYLATGA